MFEVIIYILRYNKPQVSFSPFFSTNPPPLRPSSQLYPLPLQSTFGSIYMVSELGEDGHPQLRFQPDVVTPGRQVRYFCVIFPSAPISPTRSVGHVSKNSPFRCSSFAHVLLRPLTSLPKSSIVIAIFHRVCKILILFHCLEFILLYIYICWIICEHSTLVFDTII